jgi:hypothetical protein
MSSSGGRVPEGGAAFSAFLFEVYRLPSRNSVDRLALI